MSSSPGRRYLSTEQAAEYLGVSRFTLNRYRCDGGGPTYARLGGRVLYRAEDLDAWVESRLMIATGCPRAEVRR